MRQREEASPSEARDEADFVHSGSEVLQVPGTGSVHSVPLLTLLGPLNP